MKKKNTLLLVLILFAAQCTFAQELFRYGTHSVSQEEFMRNYNRNNPQTNTDRATSLKENLELYIRYKLKVQAAYDMKYDTLQNQRDELFSFRRQIENNYLKEDKTFSQLVNQSFDRMQKDLRVSHIIVLFTDPTTKVTDSIRARKKITDIMSKLKAGEDFAKVAMAYSEDPSVAENKGDLGYITAFTFPWQLEDLAYSTPVGKYSQPNKSSFAFHIFKVTEERKAMGKIKAAQILVGFPPNATDAQKKEIGLLADTYYARLQKGENFENMARSYSSDYISAQSGGVMLEFGTGKYDPVFESAIYNLPKEGVYSRPFATAFGYHIVKRLERQPVSNLRDDPTTVQQITDMIRNDASRNEKVKEVFIKTIISRIGYKEAPVNKARLIALTDSLLQGKTYTDKTINDKTVLHSFQKQTIKVGDFWRFAQDARNNSLFRNKTTEGLLQEYVKATAMEYYRDHLEEYDAAFKNQLMEFKDGNLLFEVMEKNIWNKSAQDTVGLLSYYNANKSKYLWEASADAIVFTTSSRQLADELSLKIKAHPTAWRDTVLLYNENVQADSNRYVITDLPAPENTKFASGMFTTPVAAGSEGAAVFSYIIRMHKAGEQRSFDEARGFVINDYQHVLEEKWIADLKKKYPVVVNDKVWGQVLAGK